MGLNFRRGPFFCTTLYGNPMQASNFGGTFYQLFLWNFLWIFHRRCLSPFSIPWCKKVKNDQKLKSRESCLKSKPHYPIHTRIFLCSTLWSQLACLHILHVRWSYRGSRAFGTNFHLLSVFAVSEKKFMVQGEDKFKWSSQANLERNRQRFERKKIDRFDLVATNRELAVSTCP